VVIRLVMRPLGSRWRADTLSRRHLAYTAWLTAKDEGEGLDLVAVSSSNEGVDPFPRLSHHAPAADSELRSFIWRLIMVSWAEALHREPRMGQVNMAQA
jgi:hypothetical protein